MSLLNSLRVKLGLSNTAANNFTLTAEADNGTMKVARGNPGATTQDVLTVDAAGKVAFPQGISGLSVYTAQTTPLPADGVAVNVAHGLGSAPVDAVAELVCLTAEHGYSVGDIVICTGAYDSTTTASPAQVWYNTTNVGSAFPMGYRWGIRSRSTGSFVKPTLANWAYRFKLRTS